MATPIFPRSSARPLTVPERSLRRNRLRKILLETLEKRELLAADAFAVFAPGSTQDDWDNFQFQHGSSSITSSGTSGNFNAPGARWSNPVGGPSPNRGDPAEVTWGIVQDGTGVDDGTASNLVAFMDSIYGGASVTPIVDKPWFNIFERAYDQWSEVSGLTFVYEPQDDGVGFGGGNRGVAGQRADVRIGGRTIDGNSGVLAFNFFPTGGGNAGFDGDMVIDTADAFYFNNADSPTGENRGLFNVLMHEAGHGIGLGHTIPVNGTKLMEPNISLAFLGAQHDDILGAQDLYGDTFENDDVLGASRDLGELTNGMTRVNNVSIDESGEDDWISFSVTSSGKITVTLDPVGEQYEVGNQGESTTTVDTTRNIDLTIDLLDVGGNLLFAGNATGIGESELIDDFDLPSAGTYRLRVSGAGGADPQLYDLSMRLRGLTGPNSVADEPRLLSVSPNIGEIFSFNNTNSLREAPTELTLRFDSLLDPASLGGILITRAGKDGDLTDGDEIVVDPGWIGFGESEGVILARFADPLEDDLYKVEVFAVGDDALGVTAVLSTTGFPLDPRIQGTDRDSLLFDLELGAKVTAVVPQPVTSGAGGTVSQARNQIDVYFNDDDLHSAPVTTTGAASDPAVVRPEFYQLILTEDSVTPSDDTVFLPDSISYDPATDKATLTFSDDLDQLAGGNGTFRLRVGSSESVNSALNPPNVTQVNPGADPAGFLLGAHDLGDFGAGVSTSITESLVNVSNQLLLDYPGSNFEPGHRDIQDETHLGTGADPNPQITQAFYNFASNRSYGTDTFGQPVFTSITPEQMDRVREIYEFYGAQLGIDFVETESQGMSVVVGDLFPLGGTISGPGGTLGIAQVAAWAGGLAIMDGAEAWDNSLSLAGNGGFSFFNTALHEIGHLLGIGHTYELPDGTILGSTTALRNNGYVLEEIFPGDHDVVHAQFIHRPDNKDVDLYRFTVPDGVSGQVSIETIAERLANSSNADTHLTLMRQLSDGLEVVATNDDYDSSDSFLRVQLEAGTYFIGVTASGNEDFDPVIDDTGGGGFSQGAYRLRVDFQPEVQSTIVDINGSALDGDGDGLAGGNFDFWFRAVAPVGAAAPGAPKAIFVNKDFAGTSTGAPAQPFADIPTATAAAATGDIIRVVGTSGVDGDLTTTADNPAYEIGRGGVGNSILQDGVTLEVPQGVTLMIDAGAIFKMGGSRIVAGSSSSNINRSFSSVQVLGTPGQSVLFTSYEDESLGIDTSPLTTTASRGQWGGIEIRNDVDRAQGFGDYERSGIFLNYIGHGDFRFGGGLVTATSPSPVINPIHMSESRPTLLHNVITNSADAAVSADPDSFEETRFTEPRYQLVTPFSSDFERVGPDIRGNRLLDNTTNGLFIRVDTLAGNRLEPLSVPGRWNDSDITHVLGENLVIGGTPGGSVLETTAPDVSLVSFGGETGNLTTGDTHSYKVTFVDLLGGTSIPSVATVTNTVPAGGGVQLNNLPAATGDFVGRRLYRSAPGGASPFTLVAELDGDATTFVDSGEDLGSTLINPNATSLQRARLDARLAIDPGIVVKSLGSRIEVDISAQLIAEGTSERNIVFTSRLDDRFGAGGTFDTNQDSDGSAPAPGDWGGLHARHFSSISVDSSQITFGGGVTSVPGGFAGFNAIEVHQADARIVNSTLENNASGMGGNLNARRDGRGNHDASVIFVRGSQPVIVNNVIRNNATGDPAAISIDANSLNAESIQDLGRQVGLSDRLPGALSNRGPLVEGNRLAENGINGMRVRGATLTTESVWDDTDIVHVLQNELVVPDFHTSGGLRLQSQGDESLVVKLSSGAGFTADGLPLDIIDRIGGSLQVIGNPGFPVVLTSLADDSVGAGFDPRGLAQVDTNGDGVSNGSPGDWRSILLNAESNDRNLETYAETESDEIRGNGVNDDPRSAQALGSLADNISAGDENLRLGFTLHGTIGSRRDNDVYSFTGTAGTPVWLDIDQTDAALDTIVELIDGDGNIIALSDNSLTESENRTVTFVNGGLVPATDVQTMEREAFAPRNSLSATGAAADFQSTNPADAGFRIVLPGIAGTQGTYFVRVRSSNVGPGGNPADLQDPAKTRDGLTRGSYRLQIRMRQEDEIAGSTVRFADIRFATIGVDTDGLMDHSPLLGTGAELIAPVTNPVNASFLGNIANSDRAEVSVAGQLTTNPDVDWYRFAVGHTQLAPGGNPHVATTFDIDYADGFGRPNTSLWVFAHNTTTNTLQLVLTGTDSDITDDRATPTQGANLDDLSRGSFGTKDAFIGSQELLPGNYVVAVTNNSQVANQIQQYQIASPTNPLVRVEPLNAFQRISVDRFEPANVPETNIGPQAVAFTGTTADQVPFTLADVSTYVASNAPNNMTQVMFANALTGAAEANVGATIPRIADLAMSGNGALVGFQINPPGTVNFQTDANNGNFLIVDAAGNGATVNAGNSGIQTFTTEVQAGGGFVIQQRTKNNAQVGDGFQFNALTFYNPVAQRSVASQRLFGVGQRAVNQVFQRAIIVNNAVAGAVATTGQPTNFLYSLNPTTGAVINPAGQANRVGNARTQGAGTQVREFGSFVTANPLTPITGIANVGANLAAVSAAGELFFTPAGVGNNFIGAITPATTITDPTLGNAPIPFSGLAPAPTNLQGGALAGLLLGTTSNGTIYAFNTAGVLQPIFPGGNFKVTSTAAPLAPTGGIPVVSGVDFSPLDVNLWHLTNRRATNPGHGRPTTAALDNSRPVTQAGTNSLYFGFENANNDAAPFRQTGDWDPIHAGFNGTYNLPGGAHGAIESRPLNLSRYGADDLPTLYFNYYAVSENVNSPLDDINIRMHDAFRVYASGDNGQWILLSTNNTSQDGNFGNADDEMDSFVPALALDTNTTTLIAGNRYVDAQGRPHAIQPIFDVGDTGAPNSWRQVRASLAPFAGQSNVKLRFEFSTGASFRTGDALRGGFEISTQAGSQYSDGQFFTVNPVDQLGASPGVFEIDLGLVLNLPSGPSLVGDTRQITINGTTLQFSTTSNAGTNVFFNPADSAQTIAGRVRTKVIGLGLAPAAAVTVNSQRANVLNIAGLPAAGAYSVTGLSTSVIEGVPGVAAGRQPVLINQSMSATAVTTPLRQALARQFNVAGQTGNIGVWPSYGNTIKMYRYEIPFGMAGPINAVYGRGGDQFGVNGGSAGGSLTFPGVTTLNNAAERAQNNAFEGVYIDDIIVGLAERGETVLNAAPTTIAGGNATFFGGNAQYELNQTGVDESELGRYQLNIRTSADYGATGNNNQLLLGFLFGRTFDTNMRFSQELNLNVNGSGQFTDGDTFNLSDGINQVTFEFDVTSGPGDSAAGTTPGNIPIQVLARDSASELAIKIRNAINSSTTQAHIDVSASVDANSTLVLLHGPAALDRTGSTTTGLPALSPNFSGSETRFGEDLGDSNRLRDQGLVMVSSSSIQDSANFGITIDTAQRTPGSSPTPGTAINYPTNNPNRLAPGVVVMNNLLVGNGAGGVSVSAELFLPNAANLDVRGPATVARLVNNTIFGNNSGDQGIRIANGTSPIVLNNIIANTTTGINATGAQGTTVLGANFYQGNGTNVTPANTPEAFRITASASPFVDADNRNFYLAAGTTAIDSSLEALEELASLTQVKSSIGLPPSPTLSPDRDITGQLRVDDPSVNSPTGLGSNVFKDRGAYDRADFIGLVAAIQRPLDNDSENKDTDPSPTKIQVTDGTLSFFEVRLIDQLGGTGPEHRSVIGSTSLQDSVFITENGRRLIPGTDYVFGYNESNNTMRFTPLSGVWRPDSVYEITLNNRDGVRVEAPASNSVTEGTTFTVVTADSSLIFEWDSNGSVASGSIGIPFDPNFSRYAMAAQLMSTLRQAGIPAYLQGESHVMAPEATAVNDGSGNALGVPIRAIRDVAGQPLQANRATTLTQFTIVMPEVQIDYGDALVAPSLLADGGSRHAMLPIDSPRLVLGTVADGEIDGQSNPTATGDDVNGVDDEDGVVFSDLFNARTKPADVKVNVVGDGILDVWFDWNGDGDFEDADERIASASSLPVFTGENIVTITTPPQAQAAAEAFQAANPGSAFTIASRFRLSTSGSAHVDGLAIGGEVEDYMVEIVLGMPPTPVDDAYQLLEDTSLDTNALVPPLRVLDNDTDPDSPVISVFDEDPGTPGVQPLVDVARGSLVLNANGSFIYTPDPNFNGVDTFVYNAMDDRLLNKNPATVTIHVRPVNDAPTFDVPETHSSFEDQGLVTVPNFATNLLPGPSTATDELGQQLVMDVVAEEPTKFTIQPAIAADGTLTYQTGSDVNSANADLRVYITLTDNGTAGPLPDRNFATKTVTLLTNPVNDTPEFVVNQSQVTVIEDAEQSNGTTLTTVPGVVSNLMPGAASATDELSQTLAFDIVSVSAPELFDVQPTLTTNGDLSFKTALHQNGNAHVVVRLVDDGAATPPPNDNDSIWRTLTITIRPINDAPDFDLPPTLTVNEDEGFISQAGFAFDVRQGPVGTDDESNQQLAFSVVATDPSAFSVQPAIAPDGTITFETAPDVNSNNANLKIKVKLTDSGPGTPAPNQNSSAETTFTITVNPVNDPPIPDGYSASIREDQSITIDAVDVLVGDVAGPSDELAQALSLTQIERTSVLGGTVTPVFSGTNIRSFIYTPPTNANGVDTFLYVITDNGTPARSGTGTVTITINPMNDPPQFVKGSDQTVPEDAGGVVVHSWATGILAGPPAATDEHASQVVSFSATADRPELFSVQPAIASDGTLTFTPAVDANGVAFVTVTASDDGSNTAPNQNTSPPQTFTITIIPVNDEPVFTAGPDVTVAEDSQAYSQPWASDIQPAGGLLSNPPTATDELVQGVDFAVTNDQPNLFSVQPTVTPNGNLQFTPSRDAVGSAVVTVTAVDQGPHGGSDDNTSISQTLTITITPVNDNPIAVGDSYSTGENDTLVVIGPGLIGNDTDVDLPNDTLSAVPNTITSGLGAVVVINADGSFSYDPTSVLSIQQMSNGQSVLDTFVYEVQDRAGLRSTSAVSINIAGADDAPIANDDAYSIGVGQRRLLDVLTNDTDIDTAIDPRTIVITTLPIFGSAVINQTGVIDYTAGPGFRGVDTLGYTVRDGSGNLSNEAFVTITINTPPVAVDDSTFTFKNQSIAIDILNNDSDPDGTIDLATIQIVVAPESGTAVVQPNGTVLLTPARDFFGEAEFSYVVADNVGTVSNVADVRIRIQRSRWQNPKGNLDVNDDGFVSPIDALIVINFLNNGGESFLLNSGITPAPFLDPSGDEFVTPLDALLIINSLNEISTGGGAESEADAIDWSSQYVMTVTPEQIVATVGEEVMKDVLGTLNNSLMNALSDEAEESFFYWPIPMNRVSSSAEGEDEDLLYPRTCLHEEIADLVDNAVHQLFADNALHSQLG